MKQVALAACLLQQNTANGAQALFAHCFVVRSGELKLTKGGL
jgi:hypothetical protein